MYDHLDDPRERRWLSDLCPHDVVENAHRMYDWMRDQGIAPDSYLRELAFEKAATALTLDYDVLYNAWLAERPVPH